MTVRGRVAGRGASRPARGMDEMTVCSRLAGGLGGTATRTCWRYLPLWRRSPGFIPHSSAELRYHSQARAPVSPSPPDPGTALTARACGTTLIPSSTGTAVTTLARGTTLTPSPAVTALTPGPSPATCGRGGPPSPPFAPSPAHRGRGGWGVRGADGRGGLGGEGSLPARGLGVREVTAQEGVGGKDGRGTGGDRSLRERGRCDTATTGQSALPWARH